MAQAKVEGMKAGEEVDLSYRQGDPFAVGIRARSIVGSSVWIRLTVTVSVPCEDSRGGHWFCSTHSEGFGNQLQKDGHIQRGTHRLVWICHTHGPEAP